MSVVRFVFCRFIIHDMCKTRLTIMAKKQTPKLYVVFDTNVLFTQVASDLVQAEVQRIVSDNSTHSDLSISWFLPDVVIGERKYQMLNKAKALLPGMQKIERLLGCKFGVAEDTLEFHVDKVIKENINKYQFEELCVDTAKVDWPDLIKRSVNRRPPFEANEKEKGFRDSIIAHSFFQLQKASPVTPSVCRLVLVSQDRLLRDYVNEYTADSSNVRVLSSLDELKSLINTLVSTISEEFATELACKASKIFFELEEDSSFYYKENIDEKICEQYAEQLNNTIIPGSLRTNHKSLIHPPIFKKKYKQRIFWVSPVEVKFEIYHLEKDESSQFGMTVAEAVGLQPLNRAYMSGSDSILEKAMGGGLSVAEMMGVGSCGETLWPWPSTWLSSLRGEGGGLSVGGSMPPKKFVVLEGRDKFEVFWSVNLSRVHNLTSPKLESIEYLGNIINNGKS